MKLNWKQLQRNSIFGFLGLVVAVLLPGHMTAFQLGAIAGLQMGFCVLFSLEWEK